MSHDIAQTNGRPSMAYFRETPWRGLGTRLDKPENAEEAIEAAGLNYCVKLQDLKTETGISIPSRKAVIRSDTDNVLGVVSDSYTPIQNTECFSFLDSIVAMEAVEYHTAGALGKGEKVWMLAKLPGETRQELERYFVQLYPDRDGIVNARSKNIRAQLFHLFEHGRGQNIPETRLTAWSAFNAVTEFVDHHRSSRGPDESSKRANRLNSAWFGSGACIKADAWSAALDMAM